MRNPLDKSSAAQSLDDERLKGSLHVPASLLLRASGRRDTAARKLAGRNFTTPCAGLSLRNLHVVEVGY